ncbi:MAG: peptide-methionine (S)-S-oxide reductase [Acholeplasmatales bacterium]|nr:MAG: peptide-methionine (S)-S-oxide reductase [Acholeplasmatales bacterium]
MKTIVFAGGCFWGVEAYFKLVEGVVDTEVGYIDGRKPHPTYEEVCAGIGHAEAVWVKYDENVVTLVTLLNHLFNIVDPTLRNRQGPDIGVQYRTGLYNFTAEEVPMIENYLVELAKQYTRKVHIDVKQTATFYPAEAYHQDYLDKNKNGYCHVNLSSVSRIK